MKLYAERKKWFKQEENIKIDTFDTSVCVVNRLGNKAVRYLMRQALAQGCSVITFGKKSDYYHYVHDISPNSLTTITYNEILTDFSVPYIKNTSKQAAVLTENCFLDYQLDNKLNYLKGKKVPQHILDPSMVQSFYQIKRGNILKENVIMESVLVNIVAQAIYGQPLHEIVLFIDMPFTPVTATTLETLNAMKESSNISLISLYSGKDYDGQMAVIDCNGTKSTLSCRNKEFLLKDG